MKIHLDLFFDLVHFVILFLKPGGRKSLIAEIIVLRKQLSISGRTRKRAPNLSKSERLSFAFFMSLISKKRLSKTALVVRPSTFVKLHRALVKRKYSDLFSNRTKRKPGPKGPSKELINAIVEMKKRNPRFGCRRIAMQISNTFGVKIDKDIVWRVLSKRYKPKNGDKSTTWLTFIGHMKDSLWSLDFLCCESISLKTHWVMIIMDQYTRRIIGFAVHQGNLSGPVICRMFNRIILENNLPKYLSSDNDPLFKFHRWRANLRILEIKEIKSVPFVPISHPFVERLIRSCRDEVLDQTLFSTATDLHHKLNDFKNYFNARRTHQGLDGKIPKQISDELDSNVVSLENYRWQRHCRGLFSLPIAA